MKSDEVLHHLADCIEGFVQNSESPTNSYVYKNLDLSHAIQRQLFVKLSNNELIMDLVRRIESRGIKVKKTGLNCIENRFIDYIEGQNEVGKKQSSLRVANSIKNIAKNLYLLFKQLST